MPFAAAHGIAAPASSSPRQTKENAMPTGVQQTIEGLLCVICEAVRSEENEGSFEGICESCDELYLSGCASCYTAAYDRRHFSTRIEIILEQHGQEIVYFRTAQDTGELLCDSCYYPCQSCGTEYQYEENTWECCPEESDYIHNYSYRPHFYFHSVKDGIVKTSDYADDQLYMGIELEIAKMEDKVETFVDNLSAAQADFVYFKEDGSIGNDGAELVTMPATIDAFNKVFPFRQLDNARLSGARSFYYVNCGFHIHVSRSAFTATHMWKFVKFQLVNPKLCQLVAQRENSSYASWIYSIEDNNPLPDYVKGKRANGNRYLAINFQNRSTVELRYFKGNLLKSSILKNLEFVQSIYDYTKQLTAADIVKNHGLKEYKYYLWLQSQDSYDNLKQFLASGEDETGEN
jgi:hypothetical protein